MRLLKLSRLEVDLFKVTFGKKPLQVATSDISEFGLCAFRDEFWGASYKCDIVVVDFGGDYVNVLKSRSSYIPYGTIKRKQFEDGIKNIEKEVKISIVKGVRRS